jgi:hypothetical protein
MRQGCDGRKPFRGCAWQCSFYAVGNRQSRDRTRRTFRRWRAGREGGEAGHGFGYTWTKFHLQWKGLVAKAPRKRANRRKRERRMRACADGSSRWLRLGTEWNCGAAAEVGGIDRQPFARLGLSRSRTGCPPRQLDERSEAATPDAT